MKKLHFLISLFIVILAISCSSKDPNGIQRLNSPTESNNSELPRFFSSTDSTIYLSWVEKQDTVSSLFYAQLLDEGWSKPELIAQGGNWFVNWADFPSIIVNDHFKAAHWLQKSAEGTYDYDIKMSTSEQEGQWSVPFSPHKDGVSAEHGFVSMLAMPNDQFFATWLDGRNTKGSHGSHQGAMSLRAGVFDKNGQTISDWELDHRTCDCCQTAATMTNNGPIVVYRDRTEDETRDISIVRLINGEWTQPMPVSIDLWNIAGCPVNGPSVDFNNNLLGVAWFTGANGSSKVKFALSKDQGATFESPVTIAEGNTIGRVGLVTLENGTFVMSWLKSEKNLATIMLSQIDKTGTVIKTVEVTQTSMERASGFPVITSRNNNVLIAWTDAEESKSISTSSISF